MTTQRKINEIEFALSNLFDFRRNLIVFRFAGFAEGVPIYHECDMLIVSRANYVTEVEIKRSWSDFVADFKKKHNHKNEVIKRLWYAVPEAIADRAFERLKGVEHCCGVIAYDEELRIRFKRKPSAHKARKITDAEKYALARIGAIHAITQLQRI